MADSTQRNVVGPCAVMFAHIGGSSTLFAELGNTFAIDIVGQCLSVLANITARSGGRVIKTIDDEVMCVFPDAENAALAACDMQHAIQMLDEQVGDTLR